LGTGGAWAKPIELTRVYVVAPLGVDFGVIYPRLGRRHLESHTMNNVDTPGYAVDETVDELGRIWRVTYVQSNATEDIVITRTKGWLQVNRFRPIVREWIANWTWLIGLLAALTIWTATRHCVASRQLGILYGAPTTQGKAHATAVITSTLGYGLFALAYLALVGGL
jgi:hypothetical protein